MNRRILAVIGLIILGILLFWGGILYGRSPSPGVSWLPGRMMGNSNRQAVGLGMGMQGMVSNQNTGQGMMGMMGMMGSFNRSGLLDVEPLSVADAESAVQNYLSTLNNDDLTIGEVMVFDNHAYAQIVEESTGNGAFEVLVDPVTRNVFPEPGPNMMWNTQYSPMSSSGMGMSSMMGMMGGGMMGGMMSGFTPDVEPTVSAAQAVELAQQYLDTALPGTTTVEETADPFPGYYTIDVLRDGEIAGMLSVNAYTGQVFLHQWHGNFVEMMDAESG
jgi:hypothetical protein